MRTSSSVYLGLSADSHLNGLPAAQPGSDYRRSDVNIRTEINKSISSMIS